MPKEKIYDQSELYDIEIGWERDRDVQIGISTHDGVSLVEKLGGGGIEPASFTAVWGSLDRAGCNRLIRTLQRARDAAYGADA